MAVNPANTEEYRKATLQDLVNDAIERKDRSALEWLKEESGKKIKRIKNDGSTVLVAQPLPAIRANYAKKWLKYTNKNTASAEAQRKKKAEKKEKERLSMFEKAFEMLEAE